MIEKNPPEKEGWLIDYRTLIVRKRPSFPGGWEVKRTEARRRCAVCGHTGAQFIILRLIRQVFNLILTKLVIILTSNLGNELWMKGGGSREQETRDTLTQILQASFRPEFLNRIDEIVIFHPLSREHIARIVDIQLDRVAELVHERGYALEVSEAAREYLAQVGYDPDYGARPLKRAIQRELQDPLALAILSGEFNEGDSVRVDRGQDGLIFSAVVQPEVLGAPE